jgi:hypothetical protein
MKLTVARLRELFSEAIEEAKIGASPDYMRKEAVREHMQQHIISMVKSGEITDQAGVDAWCSAADMSLKALSMVPFDVWSKMSGRPAKKR